MTVSYDYSYDANGNLATKIKHSGSPDETTTYEYDYENRLISANLPDATTNTFTYDGDKRRISRTNAAGETTKFFYDGINILKDYDDTGAELASYTQGVGIDSLISRKDTNGARYFHADALGSTRTMTDSTQSPTATYEYDAWGKVTNATGETANEYKFTARRFEEEIGLQYNRARFYDPEIGRWITQDPLTKGPDDPTISYKSNIYAFVNRVLDDFFNSMDPHRNNRYVYCTNNPINLIDPLGLEAEKKDAKEDAKEKNKEVEVDKTEKKTKVEKEKERIKIEIDQSNLSDKEKKARKDAIDNMSVKDFNDYRRNWDREIKKEYHHASYMAHLQSFGINKIGSWEVRIRSLDNGTMAWTAENYAYRDTPEHGMHWQMFYGDGTNVGYLGDGPNGPIIGPDTNANLQRYNPTPIMSGPHGHIIKQAEKGATRYWNHMYRQGQRYYHVKFFSHGDMKWDCQEFIWEMVNRHRDMLKPQKP